MSHIPRQPILHCLPPISIESVVQDRKPVRLISFSPCTCPHLSSLTCLSQGSSETHLCPKHRPHYFCFCISSGKVEGAFWTLLLGCLLHEPNPNLLWCQKNSIFEQRITTQTVNNSLFKMCVLWGRARRMYFTSLMTLEPNLSGVVR